MREIKFRAWDPQIKEMVSQYHEFLLIDFDGVICLNESQTYQSMRGVELILMQFTGLKDSKGVEIYEGDVVEWWGVNPKDAFGKGRLCRMEVVFAEQRWSPHLSDSMEVIGNIYKNPELLINQEIKST